MAAEDDDVIGDELVMPGDKLRALARLIHLQEAQRIATIPFRSAYHRNQYLRDSRNAYESALGILDLGEQVNSEHQDHQVGASVAHNLYEYSKLTVGGACRTLWNLNLRDNYLQKIRTFAEETDVELKKILRDGSLSLEEQAASARELIQKLADYKQVSLDFMRSRQNPSSRIFATWWRQKHQLSYSTFEHMVYKYKGKIAAKDPSYVGRFEDLGFPEGAEAIELEELGAAGMLKKIEIYKEIAGLSGKGTYSRLAKVAKGAGAALILFQVGMIAWDTYTSDHPLQTLAKDSVETVVSVAGGIAGEIVGTAIATSILGAAGIAAAATTGAAAFVFVASVATGIGAAIAVGVLAGWLLDKVFKSGGKAAHKYVVRHPTTEHLVLHFAPMPNGDRLARQLTAGPKA